ncbi:hypothetical protein MKZ38_010410 [Zalerion maritima]|uniref:GRF-like zinc ribbon domain-containing protein n=1 Tax=Zalerion maritima TaxID=339359 RepID=A0AAD5WUJ3_9PEZI|nr:hypothetical protein MKZ38_010410 [Zalerion maritima]
MSSMYTAHQRRGRGRPPGSKDKVPRKSRGEVQGRQVLQRYTIPGEPGPAQPIPGFPLRTPPKCLACNWECRTAIVGSSNSHGHGGRQYWFCNNPIHPRKARAFYGWFHCYDDDRGIKANHPLCFCKMPTRYTIGGMANPDKQKADTFACCIKACEWVKFVRKSPAQNYFRADVYGLERTEAGNSLVVFNKISRGEENWIDYSDHNHVRNNRVDGQPANIVPPPPPQDSGSIGPHTLPDGSQQMYRYSPTTSPKPESPQVDPSGANVTTHAQVISVSEDSESMNDAILINDTSGEELEDDEVSSASAPAPLYAPSAPTTSYSGVNDFRQANNDTTRQDSIPARPVLARHGTTERPMGSVQGKPKVAVATQRGQSLVEPPRRQSTFTRPVPVRQRTEGSAPPSQTSSVAPATQRRRNLAVPPSRQSSMTRPSSREGRLSLFANGKINSVDPERHGSSSAGLLWPKTDTNAARSREISRPSAIMTSPQVLQRPTFTPAPQPSTPPVVDDDLEYHGTIESSDSENVETEDSRIQR